jgi:hypothetical protein
LDAAIVAGQLSVKPIGRQASPIEGAAGAPRADKFRMNVPKSRRGLLVADLAWTS